MICAIAVMTAAFPICRICETFRLRPTRKSKKTTPNCASVSNVAELPFTVCKKSGPAMIPEIIYAIMRGCFKSRMINAIETVSPNKIASWRKMFASIKYISIIADFCYSLECLFLFTFFIERVG